MYHALVKRIARANFLRVNQKDFGAILKTCAPDIHHRFGGSHALGGERRGQDILGQWFARLGRLGKHLTLTVDDIWVKGLPHDTTVIVRWSATDELPDGAPYQNRGVHIVKMRWGKVVDIDAHEDSQAVAANLSRQVELGVVEAGAPPVIN
ncbi:MAG TPA: nuclear transport factor 2 family protein [Sphingobium sp.]